MRISCLELENITSLKNTHFIDFEKIGEHSDLFAITGPTGSGKSTILTAISMALYGEHPKGINAADMVSTGEAKGSIKLTFKKNADTYEVQWSCQTLKKDGTPRKTPLTSRVLTKNGQISEEDVTTIIGLTFSQFSKVAILNQGQFSEFLSSSFTQRKDLLEKLLEHHELKTLAPFLKRKIKEYKETLEGLERQSENTLLLSKKELKVVEKDLAHKKDQDLVLKENYQLFLKAYKIIKEQVELSTKWQKGTENLAKENKEIEELIKHISVIKKEASNEKTKLDEVELLAKTQAPKISRAKELLQNKNNINQLIEKLKTKSGQYLKKKEQAERELKEKLSQAQALEKSIENLNSSLKLEVEAPELESTIDAVNSLIQWCKDQVSLGDNYQYFVTEKESVQKKAEAEIAAKDKILKDLKEYSCGDLTGESMESLLDNLKKQLSHKEELQKKKDEFVQKLNFHKETIKKLETQEKTETESLKEENDHLTQKKDDYQKELKVFELKEKNLELLEIISKAHTHMHKAGSDAVECPVCENAISSQKLSKIEDILKTEDFKTKKEELLKLKKLCETLKDQIIGIETKILAKKDQILKIGLEIEKEQTTQAQVEKSLEEIDTKLKTLETGNLIISKETLEKVQESIFTFTTHEKNIGELRKKWAEFHKKAEELSHSLSETDSKKEGEVKRLEETLGGSILSQYSITKDSKETDFQTFKEFLKNELKIKSELTSAQNTLKHAKEIIESSKKAIEETAKEITSISNEISEQEKALQAIENEFNIKELPVNPVEVEMGLQKQVEEQKQAYEAKRKASLEKEMLFEKKNGQINILKEQLSSTEDLLKRYNVNLKEALTKTLAPEKLLEELRAPFSYLRKCCDFSYQNEEQLNALKEFYEGELSQVISKLEEQQKELSREIIVLETRIAENKKQADKLSEILKKKEALLKTLSQLEELGPYLLKDGFRDFALEVLEENLLVMANEEIASLADGRYELVHGKAGKRSELLVRDLWQGNSLRKVSTLSGGETFLLSLGLALGLSEITRGQTEIDSFFIDEGFGTLDEESITQVLGCLMQMQSRGKQIGIISHVRALTDQIPIRIDLEKNNFGESQINIR